MSKFLTYGGWVNVDIAQRDAGKINSNLTSPAYIPHNEIPDDHLSPTEKEKQKKSRRIRLTCLHSCCQPIQIMWWFIWEVTNSCAICHMRLIVWEMYRTILPLGYMIPFEYWSDILNYFVGWCMVTEKTEKVWLPVNQLTKSVYWYRGELRCWFEKINFCTEQCWWSHFKILTASTYDSD